MDSNRLMRERWDRKARDNPTHWVAPSQGGVDQDVDTCFQAGKEEAVALLGPVLDKLRFDPSGKRILDIGCGIGRLFPGFAKLGFGEIWGVDISPEMIRFGEQWCPVPNAKFIVVDGGTLAGLESGRSLGKEVEFRLDLSFRSEEQHQRWIADIRELMMEVAAESGRAMYAEAITDDAKGVLEKKARADARALAREFEAMGKRHPGQKQ